MTLESSEQVIVGNSSAVVAELRNPKVMAVVWTGPWSEASLKFAGRMAEKSEYNGSGAVKSFFLSPELQENEQFVADIERLRRIFLALDLPLSRWGRRLTDLSRIEPAIQKADVLARHTAGTWHIDRSELLMLSAPSGATTEFLPVRPEGVFAADNPAYFLPDDPAAADKAAQALPNNAVMIAKGLHFGPNGGEPLPGRVQRHEITGLLHRRPDRKLQLAPGKARLLIHFDL